MTTNQQREFFSALIQISEAMLEEKDTKRLLERIMDIAMHVAGAERGFILLTNLMEKGEIIPAVARNIDSKRFLDEERYSRGVVEKVLDTGEPVITINAEEDERFKGRESVVINKIVSILSVPIFHGKESIGVIYLDSQKHRLHFNLETLDFMKVFSTQTGLALANTAYVNRLTFELEALRSQSETDYPFTDIIGSSPAIQSVFKITKKVLGSDVPVMILGNSGTGKELIARAVHYKGKRAGMPFVAQFCGALADNLLESELFGYKKGAFTGANKDKMGLLEVADGGTFFLDEIADVSMDIQTKLLRFIQEGEFRRVGDTQIRKADVRIISATNKDIESMVHDGTFRVDLFYRLNVVIVRMPTLKERRADIPLLVEYFLNKYREQFQRDVKGFSREAMEAMLSYEWPGNIRELQNTIQRGVTLCNSELIELQDLGIARLGEPTIAESQTLEDVEKAFVLKTMREVDNNRTEAARRLGKSLRWLQYRIKEWQIEA